jgi:indolepyruvate ferredoxin oxidoreductase
MGFAQKGGAVLSFVRIADRPERLNQVRIDVQQADAILACDLVVGASPEALQCCRRGRTRVLANRHQIPVAEFLRQPDADLQVDALLAKLRFAVGDDRVETFDAQALASAFVGDTVVANIVALGFAWQRGLVPVGLTAMQRAITLNGVAVEANLLAFSLGRLAAGDAAGCAELLSTEAAGNRAEESAQPTLDGFVAKAVEYLTAYQDAAFAQRFADLVAVVKQRENEISADSTQPLARTVAASLLKLMAIKDEYEVARLYTDGRFETDLAEQFEGDFKIEYHFAPPLIAKPKNGQPPRKIRFGGWIKPGLKILAVMRRWRGTFADVFGYSAERRIERQVLLGYLARIAELLPQIDLARLPLAREIAAVPMTVRGFGHVKLANLALARVREAELLHRFDPVRYPAPADKKAVAGNWKGIRVVAG